jgi:class 3 adenylate cyclase
LNRAPQDDGSRRRDVRWKSFEQPDATRRFPHGTGTFVDIGSLAVGRAVLEPGWRWSVDIKEEVGTELCEFHHLHVLVAGRMGFQMADGQEHEFASGDVMDVPAGHDAWVIGDEPVVVLDISGNISDFGLPTTPSQTVATILMTDIVGSTEMASQLGDSAWNQRLAEHNRAVRRQFERFRGREIDTTGDGFLATFDSARAALLCALAARDAIHELGIEIRVGVHTGEIEVLSDDVRGIAVHATARIMAAAEPLEVLTSPITRALAEGVSLGFESRGPHALKGFDTAIELFAVSRAAAG